MLIFHVPLSPCSEQVISYYHYIWRSEGVVTAQTVVLYKSKIFSWQMYKVSFSDVLIKVWCLSIAFQPLWNGLILVKAIGTDELKQSV